MISFVHFVAMLFFVVFSLFFVIFVFCFAFASVEFFKASVDEYVQFTQTVENMSKNENIPPTQMKQCHSVSPYKKKHRNRRFGSR